MARTNWQQWMIGSAALAALAGIPHPTLAQYRTGSDGHALDANNQAGSGGYNGQAAYNNRATGNDVVVGNVTGLSGFKGNVPYRDPAAFTGFLPGAPSETLERQSGGFSTTAGQPFYGTPTQFYDDRRGVAPPPNFQPTGATGGYVPGPAAVRASNDLRLGSVLDTPSVELPRVGQGNAGQIDPTAPASPLFLNISSLYGSREVMLNAQGNGYFTVDASEVPFLTGGSQLSDDDLMRLRRELGQNTLGVGRQSATLGNGSVTGLTPPLGNPAPNANTAAESNTANNPANTDNSTAPNAISPFQSKGLSGDGSNPNGNVPAPGAQPPGKPANGAAGLSQGAIPPGQAVQNQNLGTRSAMASPNVSPTGGDASTGQTQRNYLPPPPPPAQQSAQYAELRRRWDEYQKANPRTDEEAMRLFQDQLKTRRRYEQSGQIGGTAAAMPGNGGAPSLTDDHGGVSLAPSKATGASPQVKPVAPLVVQSIGDSISAPGLRDLVKQGEDLVHRQQFKEAMSRFVDARKVAPNNPLIAIDLANAELGAGFYKESEQNLREAFVDDPSLLMGKYDLKSMIGDDRLQLLIGDLKRIASTSTEATPVFLLAYLSYNIGDAQKAVDYLNLAQTRAGGDDQVIASLRDHWALPATGGAATTQPMDLNK